MVSAYRIEAGQPVPCAREEASILLFGQPTDAEKDQLIVEFGLDRLDVEAIHDPEEVPRIETWQDSLLVIWNWPDNVSRRDAIQFEVSTMGLLLTKGKAVIIMPRGEVPLGNREFKRLTSVQDFLLRVLLFTIHHYQGHLKAIKMMSTELESKVIASMENKYLLQMFALGESLIYYLNALETNLTILAKLRAMAERQKFSPEQIAFLDDAIIENQQAVKQANIYSSVLSGLMDARGTIVSNNMNVLLKNLMIINVVFLPLNLIASIGGMSEYSMMTHGVHWQVAYGVFVVTMMGLGWVVWWWLTKVMERSQRRNSANGH